MPTAIPKINANALGLRPNHEQSLSAREIFDDRVQAPAHLGPDLPPGLLQGGNHRWPHLPELPRSVHTFFDGVGAEFLDKPGNRFGVFVLNRSLGEPYQGQEEQHQRVIVLESKV